MIQYLLIFFDAHHKKILAQSFSNSPDKYIEKYQSLKKNDAYNNLENIIIIIAVCLFSNYFIIYYFNDFL